MLLVAIIALILIVTRFDPDLLACAASSIPKMIKLKTGQNEWCLTAAWQENPEVKFPFFCSPQRKKSLLPFLSPMGSHEDGQDILHSGKYFWTVMHRL